MLLPDLHIEGYRLFKSLELPRLAPVTLIAGTNNCGKSSLLEAAYLVGSDYVPASIGDVLRSRGESGVSGLFHARPLRLGGSIRITSGARYVRLSWPDFEQAERILDEMRTTRDAFTRAVRERRAAYYGEEEDAPDYVLVVETHGEREWYIGVHGADMRPEARYLRQGIWWKSEDGQLAYWLQGTRSLLAKAYYSGLSAMWDKVSMTSQAADVIGALAIVERGIEGIDFLRAEDNIKVRLRGRPEPVLIGTLGSGVCHLLMIALAAVTAQEKVLLVDEIDAGLHCSVLADLWRMLFGLAKRLGVQVLATTYSWDCITAFSRAWEEAGESAGLYMRLDRKEDSIRPVSYTADELAIAAEQRIEVR